jgi:hypothetical protein
MDDLIPVTPMNDMPKGSLVYLDAKYDFTHTVISLATLEEQIEDYDRIYALAKNHNFLIDEEYNALQNSIKCRMKKIKIDHCES